MIATAAYTAYRAFQTNAFLTGQIDASVTSLAEKEITSIATRRALELDGYFAPVNDGMKTLGKSIQRLLDQQTPVVTSWNAKDRLTQLTPGVWDNSNEDPGSIFVPKQVALSDALIGEINALKQIDFLAPTLLENHPDMIALYFGGAQGETLYYPNVPGRRTGREPGTQRGLVGPLRGRGAERTRRHQQHARLQPHGTIPRRRGLGPATETHHPAGIGHPRRAKRLRLPD